MKDYTITSKAGRRVAGQRNTGVGTTLRLPEDQAAALDAGELAEVREDTIEDPGNFAQEGHSEVSGGKGSAKEKRAPAAKKTGG